MTDLVSVIVPCYNQAQYLDECLQSVLDQTYPNWECIIVNDGSPDHTEEVAQKWLKRDSRFKYIKKENGGLSSARNAGIVVANGDFIQFLDCDDLIQREKLANQIAFLKKNLDASIIYSGTWYFEDLKPLDLLVFGRNGMIPTINLDIRDMDQIYPLIWRNITTISAPLYRKDIFNSGLLFDENFNSLEDWDFHFRLARKGFKFHFEKFPDSSTLIRIHSQSMLVDNDRTNKAVEQLRQKIKNSLTSDEIWKYRSIGLPSWIESKTQNQRKVEKKSRFWRIVKWIR